MIFFTQRRKEPQSLPASNRPLRLLCAFASLREKPFECRQCIGAAPARARTFLKSNPAGMQIKQSKARKRKLSI